MPGGRPSTYTKAIAAEICSKLSEGMSLRQICRDDDKMPTMSTVYLWLMSHQEFSDQYTKARDEQADTLADEIIDISDNGTNDWMEINDPDNPGYRANGEAVNRSRLRVDARKWVASKLKPKKYGEKVAQEISGPDGGDIPISIKIEFVTPDK